MTATWTYQPCPLGCGKEHPLPSLVSKRGPARQYSGEYVSPLRPAPREGQEVPLTRSAPGLREATGTASEPVTGSPELAMPPARPRRRSARALAGGE